MNHLILDMDETLISIDKFQNPVSRPYLKEFLAFCFQNFKSVSIWTSANREWFDIVNINIFIPILREYNFEFRFVWCSEKCTPRKAVSFNLLHIYTLYIKELCKVWDEYEDMTISNTIIIDDNKHSFQDNIENAINIKGWQLTANDIELIKVILLLKKLRYSLDVTKNEKLIE